MRKQTKKMIAPIVIATILVLYLIGFVLVCFLIPEMPLVAKILGGAIPLALAGVCIFVLVERIREIKGGEEDDLSQY